MTTSVQLLKYSGTVTILATKKPFVARDKFVMNMNRTDRKREKGDTSVGISLLNPPFPDWFLDMVEKPMEKIELCYAELMKESPEGSILRELGDRAKTSLTSIFALMELQWDGREGALLTAGLPNFFFVEDVSGQLREVFVTFDGEWWRMHAEELSNQDGCFSGSRVFFLNS